MTYKLYTLIFNLLAAGFSISFTPYLEADDEYPPPAGNPCVQIMIQIGHAKETRNFPISALDTDRDDTLEEELIDMAIEAIKLYQAERGDIG